jgi:hypothetical protein
MPETYRDALIEAVGRIAHESIGGSPWADRVEVGLEHLRVVIADAIKADPTLTEIFGEAVRPVVYGYPLIDGRAAHRRLFAPDEPSPVFTPEPDPVFSREYDDQVPW